MAVTFLESGTDATQDFSFYTSTAGLVTSDTAQQNTGPRAIKCDSGAGDGVSVRKSGVVSNAGTRISFYIRLTDLPTGTCSIMAVSDPVASVAPYRVRVTSAGVLQLWTESAQLGSNGSTLSAGVWYRISFAYIITSTTVNEARVFLDGNLDISVSNGVLDSTDAVLAMWGRLTSGVGNNHIAHIDDVYVDDSSALTDPGNIRVTAKLPATENTNNFDTALGNARGATDYNNVNERPLSETNGWRHAATSDVQENYGLQSASVGDFDLTGATLVARMAWLWGDRGNLILCTHRASVASGTTNPTTTFTVTIPASTATGDSLFCQVTSRDHTAVDAYPTVVDTDSGGNTWLKIGESTDRKATLWWKRATSATASKVITVAGCIGSCSGGVSVYQNAATSVTPYTNIVVEDNASGNETHAGFTPTYLGSAICLGVFNTANDNAVISESTVNFGVMAKGWEKLSTGGLDSACTHAFLDGTETPGGTGAITWAQTDGTTKSITWAVRPEDVGATADIMDNGTETALLLTTTPSLFTKITDSASYPSNAAGIGMRSSGASSDTSLYECGTLIAFILAAVGAIGPLAMHSYRQRRVL